MKRGLTLMTLIAAAVFSSTGCNLLHRGCNTCGGPLGCRPCSLGWQRGGTDYQQSLSHQSYMQGGSPSGVDSAQVGYPYYTVRGPRDFLVDNPPNIGR
jgi:hypothetical protein